MISRWLQRLGLLKTFKAKEIAKDRKEYEVNVRTRDSETDVLLPDVGFGVSQVLPVVVECFYGNVDISAFWKQVTTEGTPLVESIEKDPQHQLVTFLWRGTPETRNVFPNGSLR